MNRHFMRSNFNSYVYIIFGKNVFMTPLCKSAKFYEEKVHHTYINTFGGKKFNK